MGYETTDTNPPPTYTIQEGDSPTKIEEIFGVTLWELAEANQGVRMENNTYFSPVPAEGERDYQKYWSEGRGKLWTLEAGDVLVNPNTMVEEDVIQFDVFDARLPLEVKTPDPNPNRSDNKVDDRDLMPSEPKNPYNGSPLEDELFGEMKLVLYAFLGSDGNTIANHFKYEQGTDLIWGADSTPSQKLSERDRVINLQNQISESFLRLNDAGQLNIETAQEVISNIAPPNLTSASDPYATALVGGLQQYSIEVLNFDNNTIQIQVTLVDRFGFDEDDTRPPKSTLVGLIQGHTLQHDKSLPKDRYQPFLQRFILPPFTFQR